MSDDPVAFAEGVRSEHDRILAALKARCGGQLANDARRCGLNKGHIGGCSPITATITVSRDRLEEILNG